MKRNLSSISHADLDAALKSRAIRPGLAMIRPFPTRAAAYGRLTIPQVPVVQFAEQQGRGREITKYAIEAAATHIRETGSADPLPIIIDLCAGDLEDETLAITIDVAFAAARTNKRQLILAVPGDAYLSQIETAEAPLERIAETGIELAFSIDGEAPPPFSPIPGGPFTLFEIGGPGLWTRMRHAGPGRLGALGQWMAWSQVNGLKRIAIGIESAADEETARAFGFTHGAGTAIEAARSIETLKQVH